MASVLDLVKHYQHAIEKYPNDEQKVLKSIDKLFGLGVTVQHLQETGVGRTVNALRKDPGTVGQAARALVNKWKCMVASEESDQEADQNNDSTNYNGHGNGKDSDDSANRSRSRHNDDSERSYKSDGSRINGNTSGTKRKYHSSEEEDSSTKKSKHSSSSESNNQKRSVKVKQEPSESDDHHDSEDSQSSDSESEMSDSSGDDRNDRNTNQNIKIEPSENHRSASTKHSLHNHNMEPKKELSSSKKSSDNDRHSKSHSSDSRHSSSKTSSGEKSQSSHKHTKSMDKESSSEKKHKSDYGVEKDKKRENINLSSKHKTSSEKHRSSSEKHSNSSEKQRSSSESHKSSSQKDKSDRSKEKHDKNEKRESKSEKHSSQSHKSDKEKHNSNKSSSDKEMQKHKSRESSSSSKEKHSLSSAEKSKDRSSSSKEKSSHSHKSEKKSAHESKSKNDSKDKNKVDDRSSEKKSKHNSSSSSSHKSEKSSSKVAVPKTKPQINNIVDSDDGIDCGSGASFAEALGMASPVKPKKKTVSLKEMSSPNTFNNDLSPAAMLAPSAKLAPLPALEISALPEISPNYRPRPPPRLMPHFTDEDAMSQVISLKNQRTKVYSGNKVIGKIPTLYELCVHVLQEHIDALEFTGGVPYEILKPIVDKATPQQLFMLEYHNPYLTEDTDHLWKAFCEKHFRNKKRQEMEAWKEMYMRCQEEQEDKLKSLTANIRMTQEAKKAPIKQTKMAYVDSVVKPPRNIARKQAQHGTAFAASASPAARVAALAAAPNVLRGGARAGPAPVLPAGAALKPKKAPLMAKALQFMRGRKR
ncbi:transcription elongation factor B polypeptide 3 [Cydia amplana]|uniref:transcription elongation factor B polypeptide 3 n=1 Tax=Cydia amplana TaxID=1869771 RepID=UPI002FE57D3B